MANKDKLIKSVLIAFLALGASQSAISANDAQTTEKCFGVAKAEMNDCKTATASCAGSATKDNQADAFILLPTGLCNKLVGGHLNPETQKPS